MVVKALNLFDSGMRFPLKQLRRVLLAIIHARNDGAPEADAGAASYQQIEVTVDELPIDPGPALVIHGIRAFQIKMKQIHEGNEFQQMI